MSLAGKRVVNTRAAHQAAEFDALLLGAGAVSLPYPCIAILPPEDTTPLDQALAASDFDLLVLTSANAVRMLAQRLAVLGLSLAGVRAAAVGAATAQAARDALGTDLAPLPDEFTAAALSETLNLSTATRILLPQSAIAPPTLADALRARGAIVNAVTAYRTVRDEGGVALLPLLRARQVDAITFTSASTVRFFVERLACEGVVEPPAMTGVAMASIGPQTSQAARDAGFTVALEAAPHTLEGLLEALSAHFKTEPRVE